MYLHHYMFPAGFEYIRQIKFVNYLNPGSAVSMPAEHCYYVPVLCFKEQLLFTAGSLAMFSPTVSMQNMIQPGGTGTWQHHARKTVPSSKDKGAHLL